MVEHVAEFEANVLNVSRLEMDSDSASFTGQSIKPQDEVEPCLLREEIEIAGIVSPEAYCEALLALVLLSAGQPNHVHHSECSAQLPDKAGYVQAIAAFVFRLRVSTEKDCSAPIY